MQTHNYTHSPCHHDTHVRLAKSTLFKSNLLFALLSFLLSVIGAGASSPLEWMRNHEGETLKSPFISQAVDSELGFRHSADTSWCGAVLAAAFRANGEVPPLKPSVARNWLNMGKVTHDPKAGDIVVFWRKSRSAWEGHVGLFLSETATSVTVLGGNQGGKIAVRTYAKQGQTLGLLGYRTLR